MRRHGLAQREDGAQVRAQRRVPRVERGRRVGAGERGEGGDAGVVDEDVDRGAEGGEARVDDRAGGVGGGDVGLDGDGGGGVVVEGADGGDEGVDERGAAVGDVGDGDLVLVVSFGAQGGRGLLYVCASFGELEDCGRADAARSAGHDGDFAGEWEVLVGHFGLQTLNASVLSSYNLFGNGDFGHFFLYVFYAELSDRPGPP